VTSVSQSRSKSSGSATRHVRYTSQVLLSRPISSGGRGRLLWLQITYDDKITTSASWAMVALRCAVGYCTIRYVNRIPKFRKEYIIHHQSERLDPRAHSDSLRYHNRSICSTHYSSLLDSILRVPTVLHPRSTLMYCLNFPSRYRW